MTRMESRADYAASPDFGEHVGRLGEAELRRLLRVACPGSSTPVSRAETAELLMTRQAALTAVSAATPDVLAAVKLVHVLEDSAAVDDITAVAVWGSEADSMPHDGDHPPSTVRLPAARADVTALMGRAEDLGLVWQEPEGVWNVPPHISDVLVQDPTMATPVAYLFDFNNRSELLRKMENLGLISAAEHRAAVAVEGAAERVSPVDDEPVAPGAPSGVELLARLRTFLCSPRHVRALVDTAPDAIKKSLLLFAGEAIYLDAREWGGRRAAAVEWAVEHLLAVTFETADDTTGGEHAQPVDAAGAFDCRPGFVLNASMISPVALALKMDRLPLPTPHPKEPRTAWTPPEAYVEAATSAVAVGTAVMQLWEDGGYLGAGALHDFPGSVAASDFAASVGADVSVVFEVVGMLVDAGFMDPVTGQPTARSAQRWFSADASRRWAWLVAGWLRGPDHWVGENAQESWMPPAEVLADVAKRVRREAVALAADLDDGMMWYPCCIDSHLNWTCGALYDGLDDMWGGVLHRVMEGMRALGLLVDGAAGMPVRAVMAALGHAWLSGQDPHVDEAVELIAAEAGDFVPVQRRAQVRLYPNSLRVGRPQLVAVVRGVPGHDLAVTMDSMAHRRKCGATSEWVFTEESLADALDEYDGDVKAIVAAARDVTAGSAWLRMLRIELRGVAEGLELEPLLPDEPAADPFTDDDETNDVEAGRSRDGEAAATDAADAVCDGGDAMRQSAQENALFDVIGVDDGVVGENGVIEPPLFDLPGLRPSASLTGDDSDQRESGAASGGGAGPGAEGAAESASASDSGGGAGAADATYIEDPLRRPDSGSGPGVPTQPPLF